MSYPNYILERRRKIKGKVLDVGCGNKKLPKSIGMDFNKNTNADVVHNVLDFPYPFQDEEFDAIFLNSVIEHIDRYKLVALFRELNRILKKKGVIYVHVPFFRHSGSITNLEHVNYFGYGSLDQVTDMYVKSEFRIIGDGHTLIRLLKKPFEYLLNWLYAWTHNFLYIFFPIYAMSFTLRKHKFKNAVKGRVSYQLDFGPK